METKEATIKKIKQHLLAGRSLTKLGCIERFKYINLGNAVYEMRRDGIPIDRKWGVTPEGKKFAIYFIPPEYLNDLNNDKQANQPSQKKA